MGDRRTFGVEEEFLLLDAISAEPVPAADRVLTRAASHPGEGNGGGYRHELFQTQVESATGVCTELSELRDQLTLARERLAAAAEAEGALLAPTGTPTLPGARPKLSIGDRYERIAGIHQGVIADYQCCGCHVHVGVGDRDTAVAVSNHLRPWLATLLALAANSPFSRGRDSGFASWRTMEQAPFPGGGVPPWFDSADAYDRQVDQLVDCGVLVDQSMSFWYARLGSNLPTVEVRAADTAGAVRDALLQAALTRALVDTALTDLAAGREATDVSAQVCAAAVWNAARHGLDGPGVNPWEGRLEPAVKLAERLFDHVRPALEANGDLTAATDLWAWLRRTGTGAVRQRRAAAQGPHAVAALLARQAVNEETAESTTGEAS